jgi:hypothetical protein
MIVSDVGRTMSGSSSTASGSAMSAPPSPATSRWCVTTAHSLAKPSTCAASFSRSDFGMKSGK